MLIAYAEYLLSCQAQRFVPGGLAEGAVPACGSGDTITNVILTQLWYAGERWLADLPSGRARLLSISHLLDR
jgi:hypothetical protein